MQFSTYPFEKLQQLLEGITPSEDEAISLTIGEPQFETPLCITNALIASAPLLKKYPKSSGELSLKEAVLGFVKRRFSINLQPTELLLSFGTRELLFNFPQFLLFDVKAPKMAFTNPFYQIYEGAAIASRAAVSYINLTQESGFLPTIDEQMLSEQDLVILNFPNNPTGAVMPLEMMKTWVELALKYDFVLLNDECYSEIYTNEAPPSILEAAYAVGNTSFKNILAINSLSKRSSAPGVRSGFIAGDATILKEYQLYRTYVGCASPLPLQMAAAAAWSDDTHVETFKAQYKQNFMIAKEVLNLEGNGATFYLWVRVDDALQATKTLYEKHNIKVLPGEFLARSDAHGVNPATGYIRIALVEEAKKMHRICEGLKEVLV